MSNLTNNVKARVLNAVSAIDPIVTNASNRTANYELPLFIGSDKPAWLVDWNNTMVALDTLMKEVESVGTDNTTVIGQIQTKLADLEKVVQTAQSDITANSNNITENANNIKELTNSLNTVQDDLISQNSVIKTHTTQIADLQTKDTETENEINELNTKVENNNETVNARISNYIKQKSAFVYKPSDSIKYEIVPDPSEPSKTMIFDSAILDNTGILSRYGILIISFQIDGASGTFNNKIPPYIIGFKVDFTTDNYGFIDGEKTKTIWGGDGTESFGRFTITMVVNNNSIIFDIGSMTGLSARQGRFNVLGLLF